MSHDDTAPTPDGAAPHGCDGDLPTLLVDQIEFHMREQVRLRLEGLTDEEYFFDPTGDGDLWTVHPRTPEGGTAPTSIQGGAGEMVIDFEFPEPDPAPFTSIAWRLGHVIVGVLAVRSHSHFGGPPADYMSWDYAATAEEALAQLDREYARWIEGVRGWDEEALQVAVGEAEGPCLVFARHPRRPHPPRADPPPRRGGAAARPVGASGVSGRWAARRGRRRAAREGPDPWTALASENACP